MANRIPWSVWLVGIVALLWHAGAVMNLFMQLNPDTLAKMPASHQAVAKVRPFWATAVFAVSAFTGVLGALALLFRHRVCGPLFFISFICALIAIFQAVVTGGALSAFKGMELVLGVLGPVVIGFFFVVYTHRVRKKGWLRGTAR